MANKRVPIWVALIVLGAAALLMGMVGLFGYISLTSTPLHPDAQSVPSSPRAAPMAQWADAIQRAREIVRASVIAKNLPGVSVAVGVGGDIVWAEGFGWADLEKRTPVTPATRFRIGTASTALTSAAVGRLLEQKRLDLDEEIQTYVPEFPTRESPVTLRQLMGHLAGIRNDGGDEGPLLSQHCKRPVEALDAFARRPLLFEPGSQYRYSSYGWIVMSAAIETAAQEPFLTVMQKQVFDPAGMHETVADSSTPMAERATPYFPRFAADPRYGPDVMRDIDLSCYAGASVFVSTPSDLVRFGIAINDGRLLQPATVESLQTSQRLPSGQETGYGLGWDLETVMLNGEPARTVGHDGDVLGGLAASLMTFRERRIVIAVASNISYADTAVIALKVAEPFAAQTTPAPSVQ
jgi:CubicO group peptidase (beta-lactamase class C family)